ncbi:MULTISPECIES: hypothetical protein [Glycomyces]|uniref:Uncharacterized protein n=2 Tax=Glycomyces TaxID=58113 RepID=A0A9X3PPN8_9ACTN|nr:hypothetical protein [Glycomyces lechevalierae]MDA1387543.1 hypothetical protein [Glycomyces lechevalierae]MDR7336691.1 hypothetical protein [Glycomyces lechevalierae]
MVNSISAVRVGAMHRAVGAYATVALGTLAALAVMSVVAPRLATSEAWGHAVIVGVFALLLVMRSRAARGGSAAGLRAVVVIAGILTAANLVEAAIPGLFPSWMRVEMLAVAALTLLVMVLAVKARRAA